MYKILIFLKKTEDDSVLLRFTNSTIPRLESLTNGKINVAEIDGAQLSQEKYFRFCEASFEKKEDLDRLLQSPSGKELNKELSGFGNNISVFYANFGE